MEALGMTTRGGVKHQARGTLLDHAWPSSLEVFNWTPTQEEIISVQGSSVAKQIAEEGGGFPLI